MTIDIILSVAFLILLGLTILSGRYTKAGIGETPSIYTSVIVKFVLNVSMLAFFSLSIFLLLFYSWELFLILLAVGFITEVFLIVPLLERIIRFLFNSLSKK